MRPEWQPNGNHFWADQSDPRVFRTCVEDRMGSILVRGLDQKTIDRQAARLTSDAS